MTAAVDKAVGGKALERQMEELAAIDGQEPYNYSFVDCVLSMTFCLNGVLLKSACGALLSVPSEPNVALWQYFLSST